MAEKKYSEDQLKKIINKATKLQNEDFKADLESSKGFTLTELEKIGNEVGLKKEYLHAAAFEFEQDHAVQSSDINSTHLFEEREVPVKMTSEIWDNICSDLRNYFGSYGKITEDPKRLEWRHMSMSGIETVLNVSTFNTTTRINLSQRVGLGGSYTEGASYGFILALVVTIISTATLDLATPLAFAAFFTSWIILAVAVFGLDVAWRKMKHSELKKLSEKISKVIYKNRDQDELIKIKLETDIAEKASNNDLSNILVNNETEHQLSDSKRKRTKT